MFIDFVKVFDFVSRFFMWGFFVKIGILLECFMFVFVEICIVCV